MNLSLCCIFTNYSSEDNALIGLHLDDIIDFLHKASNEIEQMKRDEIVFFTEGAACSLSSNWFAHGIGGHSRQDDSKYRALFSSERPNQFTPSYWSPVRMLRMVHFEVGVL